MIEILIALAAGVAFSAGLLLPIAIIAVIYWLIVKGFGR
jgi:hypothetical protein